MRFGSSISFICVVFALSARLCNAQSSTTVTNGSNVTSLSSSAATSTTTAQSSSFSLSVLNVTTTIIRPLSSGTRPLARSTTVVTTFISTQSIYLTPSTTSTTTSTTTSSASPSATTTAAPSIHLATKVDGAFAVLGVLLILTGLPTAFMGHKNRWSSFFLLGFYSFMAVTGAVILKFGVLDRKLQQVNLPDGKSRGLYLFACAVSGFVGGFISIFFWQMTKYLIGALGGLAAALWIQCLRNSGLVRPVGFRWLMYIACAVIGFTLCTVPKLHYHVLLASTAVVGATVFMLGVDCFTTAGLKEFYVWNVGFNNLFTVLDPVGFVVSQTIAIELGLIAAIALAGAAVQLRLLTVLRVRLRELTEEHRQRDAELEAQATERFKDVEAARTEWEKKHGHAREDSDGKSGAAGSLLAAPLLSGRDDTPSEPGTPGVTGGRPVSSLFSLPGSPTQPSNRPLQSLGALPTLDLGGTVKDELPHDMIDKSTMIDDHPEIRERQNLVNEIRHIRRSLDALGTQSRNVRTGRHSFGDLETTMAAEAVARTAASVTARTGGGSAGRERVHSMILMPTTRPASTPLSSGSRAPTSSTPSSTRPPSAPLPDDDWETYVRERKLFQPPSGVTPPIKPSDVPDILIANARINRSRTPPPEAVLAALAERRHRETLFDPSSSMTQHESADGSGGTGTGSARGPEAGTGLQSWFGNRDEMPATPDAAARGPAPPHRRHSTNLVRAPSINTSTALHTQTQQPHTPITILPPARVASQSRPRAPPRPAERVLTYEEYTERHKARIHALQGPLTKQENKEATLADARARWEHSKAVESRVMTRKQAEEAAQVEARLRTDREVEKEGRRRSRRDSKGTGNKSPVLERAPAGPSSPKREHRRNSLSLDRLSGHRMPTHVKVEEWQKYQAAVAAEESATRVAKPSPLTPPSSP